MNSNAMRQPKSIPTELLLQILEYLSADEKRIGLLICKNWYQVFRHGLYNCVYIKNVHQLDLFLKALQQQRTENAMLSNGHLVKQLYIENSKFSIHYIHDKHLNDQHPRLLKFIFQQLPYLCPNLEVLDFDSDVWKNVYFYEDVLRWKYIRQLPSLSNLGMTLPYLKLIGRNLTTLSMQSNILVNISTQAILISILSMVPNVTKLVIKGDDDTTGPALRLTFDDMEVIHKLLPFLEELEITGNNIQMTVEQGFEDVERIIRFPIAANLKAFYLDTRLTSVIWVAYVTHKYSHLEHLKLNIHYPQAVNNHHAPAFSPEENIPVEKMIFLNLIRRCKRLLTISLSCPILDHWLNDAFFETLKQVNPGIQQVNPLVRRRSQIKFDSDFRTAVRYGKRLITAIEIEQWEIDTLFPCTLNSLRRFSRLTYLEINCNSYKDEFNIESVLDSCPSLETLVLLWGVAYIPSFYVNKKLLSVAKLHQHPLKTIQLEFLAFKSIIFDYLSNRCRSLTNLYITKCRQLCEMNDMVSQTKVGVNMPNNRFENIIINGIQLDYSIASKFFYKVSSSIRVVSIETSKETNWYHHKGYKGTDRVQPIIERLSRKDADITKSYLIERQQTKFINSFQFLGALSVQKLDDVLKTDLMFGYIGINCKSVNNFFLDGFSNERFHA